VCGRFDQNDINRLVRDFSWTSEILNRSTAEGSWNVAPTSMRPVMYTQNDDPRLFIDDRHWGYQAIWANGKVPVAINTRLEKITNRYWGKLLREGRGIVPADGWYEWTGERGSKQPWHIHRKDRMPLYFAALGWFGEAHDGNLDAPSAGFSIVTADAAGGMVDVHDRRPVVFSAEDAALWLDPGLPPEQAEEIARSALSHEYFEWYQVPKAVGNVRSQGPELAKPIDG
jgi:putative SOS response-associated peptidase YedK